MLTRTHVVFGMFVGLILINFLEISIWEKIIFLIFVLIGSYIVDIDTKNSKIGKRWFLRPLQFLTKHRGIFHSLFFGVLLSLLIAWAWRWAGVGFFVGYVLHLFLDLFTRQGVKIFSPLWNFRFRLGGVKSGGIFEEVLFVLLLLVDIFLIGRVVFQYLSFIT